MSNLTWFAIGIMAGTSISMSVLECITKATITPAAIMGYTLLSVCCVWQACVYYSQLVEGEIAWPPAS
jgi:hypothetical protein